MKAIVVGAGFAGLYAAWCLVRDGHMVTVLEASERVGGRCWSHKLSNGEYIERGGEFIRSKDFLVRKLCAEFQLPLFNHQIISDRPDGLGDVIRMTTDEQKRHSHRLHAAVTGMARDGVREISMENAAREAFGAGFASNPLYVKFVSVFPSDPKRVSAPGCAHLGFFCDESEYEDVYVEHKARVATGNDSIARELQRRLGGAIGLGKKVVGVERNSRGVVVTTSFGEEFVGDACVMAIPLPKLKELIRDLELPELVRAAIETREMGVSAAKFSAAVVAGAPCRGVQYPGETWWNWNSASFHGESSRAAVTAMACGTDTLAKLNLEDGGETWRSKLQENRPDLQLGDEYVVTNWSTDPHTEGVYSLPGLPWQPEFEMAFNQPAGGIAFAGEHTLFPNLNGALLSGQRAARSLIMAAG